MGDMFVGTLKVGGLAIMYESAKAVVRANALVRPGRDGKQTHPRGPRKQTPIVSLFMLPKKKDTSDQAIPDSLQLSSAHTT